MRKTYFNWSSGKDAALAFYHLQQHPELQLDRVLTTINAHFQRVTMHGLRKELLLQQIHSLGLPHTLVELPEAPDMEEYDLLMNKAVQGLNAEGYHDCGFGDVFLEDLRAYREEQLKGMTCHFPLWKRDTRTLIQEFLGLGFKAVVICTNADLLDDSFLGREIDEQLMNDLPSNVDPCGENGEFHTFCYAGPIFSEPIPFEKGEKTLRTYPRPNADHPDDLSGFWFIDLIPK